MVLLQDLDRFLRLDPPPGPPGRAQPRFSSSSDEQLRRLRERDLLFTKIAMFSRFTTGTLGMYTTTS